VPSRSFVLPTVIACVLAGATCWRFAGAANDLPAPVQAKLSGPSARPTDTFQLQGAGSCASAACHNADTLHPADRREYGLALERDFGTPRKRVKDRHAQAYEVLLEKRSQDIERKLHPKKKNARAETDAICLRCHVHPEFDTGNVRMEHGIRQFRLEDGVSCEACHGPAEKWLATHFRSTRTDADRLAEGQYDTRSLRGRIQLCVRCHVGEPGLEVNHDLIAAGHPRLTFEFSGFHFLMHKHWDPAKDSDARVDPRGREDFETRAWLLGQVITARASLSLLAQRADAKNKLWPEFAEHDCTSCHHNLEPSSEQRIERKLYQRRPGTLPQNGWHVMMLTKALEGLGAPADEQLTKALEAVRAGLETLPLQQEQAADNARQAVKNLDRQLDSADARSVDPDAGEKWLATWLTTARAGDTSDDQTVQLFLAGAALSRARKDMQPTLIRPTMRLLLQLPTSDHIATIDPAEYRQKLVKLREKPR
jgi:hypothetical protein